MTEENYITVDETSLPCNTMAHSLVFEKLRTDHNIFVAIYPVLNHKREWGYSAYILKMTIPIPPKVRWDWFDTYEEACETTIKYCKEKLCVL